MYGDVHRNLKACYRRDSYKAYISNLNFFLSLLQKNSIPLVNRLILLYCHGRYHYSNRYLKNQRLVRKRMRTPRRDVFYLRHRRIWT